MVVVWDLGHACNLRCEYCYLAKGFNGGDERDTPWPKYDLNEVKNFVSSLPSPVSWSILGGEPFYHPQFMDIIDILREHGIKKLGGNTNLLNTEVVNRLAAMNEFEQTWVASFHLVEFMKKGVLFRYLENLKTFKGKATPQVVMYPDHIQEIYNFERVFPDIKLEHMDYFSPRNLSEDNIIENYKCIAGQKAIFIRPDGEIYICAVFSHEDFARLGSIKEGITLRESEFVCSTDCHCRYSEVFPEEKI